MTDWTGWTQASGRATGRTLRGIVLGCLGGCLVAQSAAWAEVDASPAAAPASAASAASTAASTAANAPPAVRNSALNARLFYEVLMAEFARKENQPKEAIALLMDAARRSKDESLFRRAIEVAVENASGESALSIAKAWRQAFPKSADAVRIQLQLLFALDRVADTTEPLRTLLAMSSGPERVQLIAGLPGAAQRARDKAAVATQFQQLLAPYLAAPETRTAARVALGRMRLEEGNTGAALELARGAQAQDPQALGPVLLALDLMLQPGAPPATGNAQDDSAEAVVRRYLAGPDPEPLIRQALADVLTSQQRLSEAAEQLRLAAQARPKAAVIWLGLGELELELQHADAAERALHAALDLVQADPAVADPGDEDLAQDAVRLTAPPVRPGRIYLLLARCAELRKDDAGATRWLDRIEPADVDLQVIALRASLLARAGRLDEARALVRAAPADTAAAQRLRVLVEVQLLREQRKLEEAEGVLAEANARMPNDVDLLYEQAMMDERLNRLDSMERLLRQVLVLRPDHAQALNALGYSLADRGLRLEEARQLVARAHELAPSDPFIADSLGWVEFRLGHADEAARWLRQAYAARNDIEIAAHLGEALWVQGRREEALKIWREAQTRDAGNEMLRGTLARLKAAP